MEIILELKSITAGYHSNIVLENINLSVYKNDFLGIIGPNGGGKTTLLKIILGLLIPFQGEINFCKKTVESNCKIGYLPQFKVKDKKFPIKVIDVVLSGFVSTIGNFQKFSNENKQTAENLLERLGIIDLKDKMVGELSGGQMQRVFLARAIISSPKLLILDEPSTFVDSDFEKNLYDLLKELNQSAAIILVSHDLGMIPHHVKNIACVNRHLHYHNSNKITQDLINNYNCPIELISHGKVAHRVLKEH